MFNLTAQEKRESAPPAAAQRAPQDEELQKAVGAAIDPSTYIIGAEDILKILIWREPDLSGPVLVRPDGMISLALLKSDMKAAGMTPKQLEERITKAYGELVNNPNVTVSVATVNSKKYFVGGEINRPGQYPLVVPTTVSQALTIAGGFREYAGLKNILIRRGPKLFRFNWKDYVQGKNLARNIPLENGDEIIVP
jgi:polysaccharide export outer membrane protein